MSGVVRETELRQRRGRGDASGGSAEPMTEGQESDTEGFSEFERDNSVTRAPISMPPKITEERTIDAPAESKYQKMWTRTKMTLFMFSGMFLVFAAGHFYCACLVILLMIGIFSEILQLKRNKDKEMHLPFFFLIRWHFFGVATLFFIRKFLAERIEKLAVSNVVLRVIFVSHHMFIVYCLMMLGIMMFVLSLRKFSYRYQFYQLGWTAVTLLLVCAQCCAQIATIYQGLIWFWIPASLVVCNDSMAYFAGSAVGRTKLIALSPKKTVEGFVGGGILTVVWGIWFCGLLQQYPQLTCPMNDLSVVPFNVQNLNCSAEDLEMFVPDQLVTMPSWMGAWEFTVSRMQIHTFYMSLVAAIVAPFGGFFASGFKRAFKIKDFGDIIPGHGGFTDRLDCHIVMGMFVYVYLQQFVYTNKVASLSNLVNQALQLSAEDQAKIVEMLKSSG